MYYWMKTLAIVVVLVVKICSMYYHIPFLEPLAWKDNRKWPSLALHLGGCTYHFFLTAQNNNANPMKQ